MDKLLGKIGRDEDARGQVPPTGEVNLFGTGGLMLLGTTRKDEDARRSTMRIWCCTGTSALERNGPA
jgi:hypothetical protein